MNISTKMPKLEMDNFRMLINGDLVESESRRWFPSINPANEEILAQVPLGSPKDVDRAVEAAEKAQPPWASLPVAKRSEYLNKLAAALKKRAEELLYLDVLDTGNTILKMKNDVSSAIETLLYFAGLGYEIKGSTIPSTPGNLHLTLREPYGVVGRIVPFNHPIKFAIAKMGPPLDGRQYDGHKAVAADPSFSVRPRRSLSAGLASRGGQYCHRVRQRGG